MWCEWSVACVSFSFEHRSLPQPLWMPSCCFDSTLLLAWRPDTLSNLQTSSDGGCAHVPLTMLKILPYSLRLLKWQRAGCILWQKGKPWHKTRGLSVGGCWFVVAALCIMSVYFFPFFSLQSWNWSRWVSRVFCFVHKKSLLIDSSWHFYRSLFLYKLCFLD